MLTRKPQHVAVDHFLFFFDLNAVLAVLYFMHNVLYCHAFLVIIEMIFYPC